MSERPLDPRYSAAFQRQPDGDVESPTRPPLSRRLPGRRASSPDPAPATVDFREPVASLDPAESEAPTTVPPVGLPDDGSNREGGGADPVLARRRRRSRFVWTLALFALGAGLCVLSFVCYVEFDFSRWSSATPIAGTDQWVISDGTGIGTRTVDRVDVLLPRYMSEMAIWIGAVGVATIVVNLFRIAAHRSTP